MADVTAQQRAKYLAEAEAKAQAQRGTNTGLAAAGATGLRGGVESLAGTGGDIPALAGAGADYAASKLGVDPEPAATLAGGIKQAVGGAINPIGGIARVLADMGIIGPGAASVMQPTTADIGALTDKAVGAVSPAAQEFTRHKAANDAERWTETGASFLPNMVSPTKTGLVRKFLFDVAAPTVGTELGGEWGKESGHETLGRLLGGGIAAAGGPAAMRGMVGTTTPDRAALVRVLQDARVPVTAGQVTGRKGLQYLEAGPFGTRAGALANDQAGAFNRAAWENAGIDARKAGPAEIEAARDALGADYDRLAQQSRGIAMDQGLEDGLTRVGADYERLAGHDAKPAVSNYFRRIVDEAARHGGVIPPDVFQQIRSDIARDVKLISRAGQNGDTLLRGSLLDLQDELFGSMERAGQPDVAQAWRDTNRKWRNLKIIEKAMGGAGEQTALGDITPGKLRNAVEGSSPSDYVAGRGDMAQLARAGELIKPLPQTGSAPRALIGSLGAYLAGAGQQALSGDVKGAAQSALLGAAVPAAASALVTRRPVRTALVRQAIDPLPILDPVTAALLARQAETQGGQ